MKTTTEYQPKTGQTCSCKPGQQRDNCPQCEGTGMRIDFAAIRSRAIEAPASRDEAAYRVALKRALTNGGVWHETETPTASLEQNVILLAKSNPKVIADQADRVFRRAAQAWEDGNNSGNDATLQAGYVECDRQRGIGERVMALFGVECDYPGLYPTFTTKARHVEYTALAAIQRS